MKYLVFGSLNIDRTYSVPHFVAGGETLSAGNMELFCGGKGFNQAVALARAGEEVYFAGAVGNDGQMLMDALSADGIHQDHIKHTAGASGHAIIQVDPSGQNCILILAGANGEITHEDVDRVLEDFGAGDLIVLQNEISSLDYILKCAAEKGMVIALNPSPFDARITQIDLSNVDYLLVNEVEAEQIAGCKEPECILERLHSAYPRTKIVLTLGTRGAVYSDAEGNTARCGIYRTNAVDTTAAGDTFTGYFLSTITSGAAAGDALALATIASGISVSRPGASPSIPHLPEVQAVDRAVIEPFGK